VVDKPGHLKAVFGGNVVDSPTIPLAPSAHIPWRLRRRNLQPSPKKTATPDSEWLVRQEPTDQQTGACVLRGLKRSCSASPPFGLRRVVIGGSECV
jgi:hypothetical protein